MSQILRSISARQTSFAQRNGLKAVIQLSDWSWPIFRQYENANDEKLSTQSPFKRFISSNSSSTKKLLTIENINPNFNDVEYAVRGPISIRANEIEGELKKGAEKPFTEIVYANIGDPQAMGQKPMTYVRQLLALLFDPSLIELNIYPEDVKQRAREILSDCRGQSISAYSDSAGIPVIRKQVARFIEKRDCVVCDWKNICLSSGATPVIKTALSLVRSDAQGGKPTGIMVSVPQYPLYTATMTEYGIERIFYYLQEDKNWALDIADLKRAYDEAKGSCNPRAISVINPGNPTGQVLTRANMEEIVKFAYENKLVVLADEVYQDNILDPDSKFYSFKKVMYEMGPPYRDMELFSFMSTSKGIFGECGIRGGYTEVVNLSPEIKAVLMKVLSTSMCASTPGQAGLSALVNPPQAGEPSYRLYMAESTAIRNSLRERAELIYKTMSTFEGFKVNKIQGAMFAFPQIELPAKAIEAAKAKNMKPDEFYAFELLEATGNCIIYGSGFGQKPGTYHFRTTILPPIDKLKVMLETFKDFHADFMQKYK